MIVMQADFTDQPEHLPELVKRFEGGVDIVMAERRGQGTQPAAVKRFERSHRGRSGFRWPWRGVADPFASFRLYRISSDSRACSRSIAGKPVVSTDGWAANLELLLAAVPLARRVEKIDLAPRYDLRTRESRIRPFSDSMALYRFGRAMQGRRLAIPVAAAPSEQSGSGQRRRRPKAQAAQ